jgi:O-antigen ligase
MGLKTLLFRADSKEKKGSPLLKCRAPLKASMTNSSMPKSVRGLQPPELSATIEGKRRLAALMKPALFPTTPTLSSGAPPVERTDPFAQSGIWILAFYLVLVFSRAVENIPILGTLHIPMISMLFMAVMMVLTGDVPKILSSKISFLWAALTVWVLLSTGASVWPGGSVEVLRDYWIPALLLFAATTSLALTRRACDRLLIALAISMLVILIFIRTLGYVSLDRLMVGQGTLANSNFLALQLLFGMPFCMYLIFRKPLSLFGILGIIGVLISLYNVINTGSRAGFLSLVLMWGVLFLLAPFVRKLQLLSSLAVVTVFLVMLVPGQVWSRISTSFVMNRTEASSMDELSAVESSLSRWRMVTQGIDLTLANPLLGVGPGMFIVATSDEMAASGRQAFWTDSHNSYTQVSSETGLPGFLLFLAILLASLKELFSLYRRGRNTNDRQLSAMSLCLLLSLTVTMITAFFANIAYHLYFPILTGLTVALAKISTTEIVRTVPVRVQPRAPVMATLPVSLPRPEPVAIRYGFGRVRQPVRRGSGH